MSAPDPAPARYRALLRPALAWATVLLIAIAAPTLWPSASSAATGTSSATGTTTSSGGPGSCEQYPPMAAFGSATSTSLTFSVTFSGPSCGFPTSGRLYLNTTQSFTGGVQVAITPGTDVTVPNLQPGTAYYWVTSGSSPVSSGWKGPVSTLTTGTTTSRPTTTTTTTTLYCDPIAPKVSFVSASSTSLTLSYQAYGTASCGGEKPVTVSVSQDQSYADSTEVTGAWPSGTVTVNGLKPSTGYYFVGRGGGSPFGNSWQGPVSTLASSTTTTTCDVLPPPLTFVSATTTSLTFSYQAYSNNSCAVPGPVTITASTGGTSPVSYSVVAPWPSGTATVTGLSPGTRYFYSSSGGGSTLGSWTQGTASTLSVTTTTTATTGCRASYTALSSWTGNFMANIVVTNTSSTAFTTWRVSWTWPGGQSLVAAYSAVAGGSGSNPTISNPSWGGQVAPGGHAETVIMGAGAAPASAPALTCTAA